jgi:hypothetical protein
MGKLEWTYMLVPFGLVAGFLYFQFLYRPRRLARVFKQQKDLSAPFEMEISEQGFHIISQYGNELIPWSDLAKWSEGKDQVLLYRSDVIFHMIPKHLLAGEGDLQFLLGQLTRNNVPDARKDQKRKLLIRYSIYIVLFIAIVIMVYMNLRSVPR